MISNSKRKKLDRIIVPSNEKMSGVIDWFDNFTGRFDNKKLLGIPFNPPMEIGVVELQEEGLEFTFESLDDITVRLEVYPIWKPYMNISATADFPSLFVYTFDITTGDGHLEFENHVQEPQLSRLKALINADKTHLKEELKYISLMMYMNFASENIEIEERGKRSKHEAKTLRKNNNRPLPLIKKRYILSETAKVSPTEDLQKRSYTKPTHEVSVRGFYRKYKSGKVVWVHGFKKYKGKEHTNVYSL